MAEVLRILAVTALAAAFILIAAIIWFRYGWAERNALKPRSRKDIMDNVRLLRRLAPSRPRTGGRHRH